jgi:hypothetical protein
LNNIFPIRLICGPQKLTILLDDIVEGWDHGSEQMRGEGQAGEGEDFNLAGGKVVN